MDPTRIYEVIDDNGNVWQRQPSGNWFVVQSATVDGEEDRWIQVPPASFSNGMKAWLLIANILLLGALGAFWVLT